MLFLIGRYEGILRQPTESIGGPVQQGLKHIPGEDRDYLWGQQGQLELPPCFEGKPNYHGNAPQYCKNLQERAPHVPLVADNVMDPTTVDHPTGAAVRRAISNQFFGLFLFQSGSQLSSISFWMSRFTDMA